MNYTDIYNSLVIKAKKEKRVKSDSNYYEDHHITPKCLGGLDFKSNMVLFTPREHLVAHRLLTKIYPNSFELKVAVLFMASICVGNNKTKVSSRLYEKLRLEVSKNRIENATHPLCMPFNIDLKLPIQFSNKIRHLKGLSENERKVKPLLDKIIMNLLLASSFNYTLTYPRNKRNVFNNKILKCEKILIRLGLIDHVVVDSESPLALRKRCKVVASAKLLETYKDCLEHIVNRNEDFVDKNFISV